MTDHLRPLTHAEASRMLELVPALTAVDVRLAKAIAAVALGDDSVMDELHDRLNVIGRPELADRLRKLLFV